MMSDVRNTITGRSNSSDCDSAASSSVTNSSVTSSPPRSPDPTEKLIREILANASPSAFLESPSPTTPPTAIGVVNNNNNTSTSLSPTVVAQRDKNGLPNIPTLQVRFLHESSPDSPTGLYNNNNNNKSNNENAVTTTTTKDALVIIEKLQHRVQQLEVELSAERAMRRKKEKNLVKLAKQLSIKTQQASQNEQQVLKMARTINELENMLRHHHMELANDQEKLRQVCRETEQKLEDYERIMDDLRKQLFQANLTTDQLRTNLAALEMKQTPTKADDIARRYSKNIQQQQQDENENENEDEIRRIQKGETNRNNIDNDIMEEMKHDMDDYLNHHNSNDDGDDDDDNDDDYEDFLRKLDPIVIGKNDYYHSSTRLMTLLMVVAVSAGFVLHSHHGSH